MSDKPTYEQWTTQGFLQQFMHIEKRMEDRRFCFLIGSGASKTSGVQTGAELVDRWLKIHQQHCDPQCATRRIEDWATADNLCIPNFEYSRRAEFYAYVFHATFGHDFQSGYADLEQRIEHVQPSVGYSVLAQILSGTRHRVVITTNFDNLIADALAIYTEKLPLICGHEALAGFAQTEPRRPLIVKVHHDLLLNPKNTPEEISTLPEGWKIALRALLRRYTPIVLGYGGNDEGLMNFLAEDPQLSPVPGNMFWLYRGIEGVPTNERIRKVMTRHRGIFVPCVGFDEIMSQLRAALDYPYLAEVIEAAAKKRVQTYKEQFQAVLERLEQPESQPEEKAAVAEVTKAIAQTVEKKVSKQDWVYWYTKAQQESDPAKREMIYQQGVAENPDSADLTNIFANFLANNRREYDKAEQMYQKTLEIDSENALYAENYAVFLEEVRKDYSKAEQMYQKALELDPNNVYSTESFALFLASVRKDYAKAEQMFQKALELDPKDTNNTANYAAFLLAQGRTEQASAMIVRAWDLCQKELHRVTAKVALYRTLLAALNSENINVPVGQIKTLLQKGFTRVIWSFDEILSACAPKLSPEQNQLFRAVADAILDESKQPALESLPAWQNIQPVPLE